VGGVVERSALPSQFDGNKPCQKRKESIEEMVTLTSWSCVIIFLEGFLNLQLLDPLRIISCWFRKTGWWAHQGSNLGHPGWFMNAHRTALVLFAVALGIVIAAASVTTLERVNTRKVSNDAMPGTMGLAKLHPQLDGAPGQPIVKDR
jgi:hypothetical protein